MHVCLELNAYQFDAIKSNNSIVIKHIYLRETYLTKYVFIWTYLCLPLYIFTYIHINQLSKASLSTRIDVWQSVIDKTNTHDCFWDGNYNHPIYLCILRLGVYYSSHWLSLIFFIKLWLLEFLVHLNCANFGSPTLRV